MPRGFQIPIKKRPPGNNTDKPQLFKRGFSLIETVLSLFLFLGIIAIFLSASGTFISTRGSALQTKAARIATREIENLRNTNFASLPSSGAISDSELGQLPSGSATRTVTDYLGNSQIKQIKVSVNWTDKNVTKKIDLETLISENGL